MSLKIPITLLVIAAAFAGYWFFLLRKKTPLQEHLSEERSKSIQHMTASWANKSVRPLIATIGARPLSTAVLTPNRMPMSFVGYIINPQGADAQDAQVSLN